MKGGETMEQLTKEYSHLFNGISAAIVELQAMTYTMVALQQQAEEIYISRQSQPTVDGSTAAGDDTAA